MAKCLTVLGFWGLSGLICLPAVTGGAATLVALLFLGVLVALSTYLYSSRFATLVDALLQRTMAVRDSQRGDGVSA